MIDLRWPQQHYARTAVWAGQRLPLLQRLLARAGDGETRSGGGHTGLVYRTARAFPVTLTSSGADWPTTAAVPFDIRQQATPDSSGKVGREPFPSAASTANAGPLADHLTQRATRPPGVIQVQPSGQQASRTAGEFGPALSLLRPLLARYDSGRGAETGSGSIRAIAASPARWPATGHDDQDPTPRTAFDDSFFGGPTGEPTHHGQSGSLRSAVTQATGATPEMARRSSIAGQVDCPPSAGFTAEPSPPTVGSVRVRRKALPATPVFSTRHGAAPNGKPMAHDRQPDDQPTDGVATPAAIGGPATPGTRSTTDPQSSDRIATILSASTADFSATSNAGLRERLLSDYPTPAFPPEAAAANRRAVPEARVAARLPLATGRQAMAHAVASATRHDRAVGDAATLFRRATGALIRQPGNTRTPVATPSATPGAVSDPAPIDDHRFDGATALNAKRAAHVGPPAAAIERPAIDRSAADRSEAVRAPRPPDFSAPTVMALSDTPDDASHGRSPHPRSLPRERARGDSPVARATFTVSNAWLHERLPRAARAFAPYAVEAGSERVLARTVAATLVSATHPTADPPFAGQALATGSAAERPGSLPLADPAAARQLAASNKATPRAAVTSARPVIQQEAAAAATDPAAGMVWRQRVTASPSSGAGTAGILESTRALTVAAHPADGGVSHASADGQPSLAAPTSDIPLPAATVDWDALITQISRRILRQLTIERERRGIKGWH